MRCYFRLSRLHPLLTLFFSVLLIGLSALLLSAHAKAVSVMRETGLPAALRLVQIEERATVLREQNDAAELQAALRTGTEEEILRLSVLPADPALDRLLPALDVFFSSLQDQGMVREFPTMTVGDVQDRSFEAMQWRASPVRFTVIASEEGIRSLFAFIEVAGMLTVSDLLSQGDINRLLSLTEAQNPAAITALEEFLSADVLRFAESPRPFQDQLFGALPSPLFAETLQSMLDHGAQRSRLALLRQLAPRLRHERLWPLRFLSIDTVTLEDSSDGWVRGAFVIEAAGRPNT